MLRFRVEIHRNNTSRKCMAVLKALVGTILTFLYAIIEFYFATSSLFKVLYII